MTHSERKRSWKPALMLALELVGAAGGAYAVWASRDERPLWILAGVAIFVVLTPVLSIRWYRRTRVPPVIQGSSGRQLPNR